MAKISQLKSYLVYGSGQIINLIAPILVAPHIILVCGMENWGKISMALAVVTILNIFIDFGSLLVGVKEISSYQQDEERTRTYLNHTYHLRFWLLAIIALVYAVLIFAFDSEIWLYGLAFMVVVAQVFNPIWFYQGNENFAAVNRIVFFSKVIYIALIYIFIREPQDYIYSIFLLGIANTLIYFLYYLPLHKRLKLSYRPNRKSSFKHFKNEYPIVVSNLSISVYVNAPILIIGMVVGSYESGIYKLADMVLNLFRSYLAVFFNVSFPRFCALSTTSFTTGIQFLKQTNKYNLMFVVFCCVTAYFTTHIVLEYVYFEPEVIRTIAYSANFLFIPIVIACNIPFYQSLIFHNEQKALSLISFVSAVLMCFFCYILTSLYALNGSVASVYVIEFITTSSIIIYYRFRKWRSSVLVI